jgi:hypothetical protein
VTNLEIRTEHIYNLIKNGLENQFDSRLAKIAIENELQKTVRETLENVRLSVDSMLNPTPKPILELPEPVRVQTPELPELPSGYKFSHAKRGLNIVRLIDSKVIKSFPHHTVKNLKQEDFKQLLNLVFSDLELKTNQFLIDLTAKLEIPNGYYLRVKRFMGEEYDRLVLWSADYYLKKVDREDIIVLMSPFETVQLSKLWVSRFQGAIDKGLSKKVKQVSIPEWDTVF